MKTIFMDTVGLIALWERDDQWHNVAMAAFQRLMSDQVRLVTTPQVLLECGNAAARRPYRQDVVEFRQRLADLGSIIEPTDEEVSSAWHAYAHGTRGQAGIVDLISFVVMQRLNLTHAFTNDRHFAVNGFQTLF